MIPQFILSGVSLSAGDSVLFGLGGDQESVFSNHLHLMCSHKPRILKEQRSVLAEEVIGMILENTKLSERSQSKRTTDYEFIYKYPE